MAAQRPTLGTKGSASPPSSPLGPITNTCSSPGRHPRETSLPPSSATGYHSETLRNARHVVEHDAQKEDQDAGHQDHSAHPRPGGAFRHAPSVWLLLHHRWRHLRRLLLGRPALQRLLLRRDGHHGNRLLLVPWQQAAARVSGQWRSLLGDGQGQHVAPIAGKFDEDRGVLGGMRDGNDGKDLRVVGELRHGEACRQLGDAPAPRAPHILLACPHLLKAHGAAGVFAIQQLGPAPGAVVIETDLTFQQGILGERLHRELGAGKARPRGRSLFSEATGRAPSSLEPFQGHKAVGELTGMERAQARSFLKETKMHTELIISNKRTYWHSGWIHAIAQKS